MIGAVEKGVEKWRLSGPDIGKYGDVDLSNLPSFICFKAAMAREKLIWQYAVTSLLIIFVGHFIYSSQKVSWLYSELRKKEYILAPGVQSFLPASPQMVSDKYVEAAASEFIAQLANVGPSTIRDTYQRLSDSMAHRLKAQFLIEAAAWIEKVSKENLTEVMSIDERKIVSNELGQYRQIAKVRIDSYMNHEHIGYRNEVIDLKMRLIPPTSDKRWFLEMTDLSRTSNDAFNAMQQKKKGG